MSTGWLRCDLQVTRRRQIVSGPPCSVGPADAEAMRSTANLVVAHMLRSQLLGFALANFLLSIYALWACLTKARRWD
jgi:hypothetical protein